MANKISSPVFGTLSQHGADWIAEIEWRPCQRVGVTISPEEGQELPALLAVAERSVEWLRADEAEAGSYIGGELFALWEESWADAEEVLDLEAFTQRIRLSHVMLGGGGSMILTFDDDGLFGGHEITAAYSPEQGWWDCSF